jgi:pimeloyl-ACP methyl ester carboxylesterase
VIKEMDLKLAERGIRWVSYDRPGYMSSTARPGRDKASVAADAAAVADALGIGEFAVLGHSGGGSHALACGALLPGRVKAVAEGVAALDWLVAHV